MYPELIHYSDKDTLTFDDLYSVKQGSAPCKHNFCIGKPTGLWASVEDGQGWRDWCTSENFRTAGLAHSYAVGLTEQAKLLHLSDANQFEAFSDKYRCTGNSILQSPELSGLVDIIRDTPERVSVIDWTLLEREGYQGIIISPYQWEWRLASKTAWYYGWDCSSACIWDVSAIKSLTLIEK